MEIYQNNGSSIDDCKKKRYRYVCHRFCRGMCSIRNSILKKLRECTIQIGARGDITVALFAALAFGGVVVPVTLLGDFFHVILGPFSGLITGILMVLCNTSF